MQEDQIEPPASGALPDKADSLEVQLRVKQLMHALAHNPAITCPITFNWHGASDLAEKAGLRLRVFAQMMQEERPGVSFKELKAITFHHDYELALKEAVGNDRAAPLPSREVGGLSVGMMVHTAEGVHIVMHESVALALAHHEDEDTQWAEHMVRHELCHADDASFKKSLLKKYPEKQAFTGFEANFSDAAMSMWDEFYANKYSFGPWSDPRMFLDLLRDTVPAIRTQLIEAILRYRSSNDLNGLVALAAPKVRFVAQCFGYASGTLAAMGTTLEKEAPDEHTMLNKFGLLGAWDTCYEALLELDDRRPGWESLLDIKELIPGCTSLFAGFGLHYRPYGTGAWLDIPSTPETGPMQVLAYRLNGVVNP